MRVGVGTVLCAGWTFCDQDPRRAREMAVRWIGGGYWEACSATTSCRVITLKHTKGYDPRVWGTPAQCIEKILDIRTRLGCETFVGVLSYAGMPWEERGAEVHPFAPEVRPALPALDGEACADVPTPAEAAARQA